MVTFPDWVDPNEPDVDWSCVEYQGQAWLVVQATGPALSAVLLAREYKTVEVRFTFSPESMLENLKAGKPAGSTPESFICFADGEFHRPLLVCEPDPMLYPIQKAITDKKPWMLVLQVMVEGQPHTKLITVGPDWKAKVLTGPDGESMIDRWVVAIVDEVPRG